MTEKPVSVEALHQPAHLRFLKWCFRFSTLFLLFVFGYVFFVYFGNLFVLSIHYGNFAIGAQTFRLYLGAIVIIIGLILSIYVWRRQASISWQSKLPGHILIAVPYISFGLALISPVFRWLAAIGLLSGILYPIVDFIVVTASHPPYYRAINNHLKAGNYNRALEFVEKSLQQKPNDWKTYHARAAIYCSIGVWDKAENDARHVIQLRPQEQTAYEFLGCALISRGDYKEAASVLQKAIEISSKSDSLTMLGKAHYRLGEYAAAAKDFELALQKRLEPKSRYLAAAYYLASSLEKIGETSRAQAAYQKLAQYKQTLPEFKGLWADKTHVEAKLMQADIADIERRIASL